MATILVAGLTAKVSYRQEKTGGPNGRTLHITDVAIMAGETVVATKTIAGKWSQRQAVNEFKRLPKGWEVLEANLARLDAA